jgi:RNA polymerase sigma factor (sigma-70 family)
MRAQIGGGWRPVDAGANDDAESPVTDDDVVAGLVRAACGGDAVAWQALVARFSGLIWSVVRAYRLSNADAADVFQTAWLRLAEYLDRLDNPSRVGAWLATTARRESLRVARAGTRTVPTAELDVAALDEADDRSPERALLEREQQTLDAQRDRLVWAEFRQLSDRCQQLLRILMAAPPPSYVEVAAALDMPVGSIGPTRGRCLRQLRQKLARRGITGRLAHS